MAVIIEEPLEGVTIKPLPTPVKLRYLVLRLLSMAFATPSFAGVLPPVIMIGSPGEVTSPAARAAVAERSNSAVTVQAENSFWVVDFVFIDLLK